MIASYENTQASTQGRLHRRRARGKKLLNQVGVAFVNRDNSLTIRLDAVPVNGMLQVRDDEPGVKRGAGGAQ